jgi:CheY-like chemotaxis protein
MKENINKPKPSDWSRKTILVVDDDYTSRILIEEILDFTQVRIEYADDGLRAVNICKTSEIDLVLMDLRMPFMDGFIATKLIRKFLPNLPIIAVSACAFVTDREHCKEVGFNDYISKPFEINNLIEKIAEGLFFSFIAIYE